MALTKKKHRDLLVIGDTEPLDTTSELPGCYATYSAGVCSGMCGVLPVCESLGQRSFVLPEFKPDMLDSFSTVNIIPASKTYILCDTPKLVDWLFGELDKATDIAWDFETTHCTAPEYRVENDYTQLPIGISFSWKDNTAAYLPLYRDADGMKFWPEETFKVVVGRIKSILEKPSIFTHLQNSRFDVKVAIKALGVYPINVCYDTMLMHHLLDENRSVSDHSLDKMAAAYLDPHFLRYDQVLQKALDFYDPKYRRYAKVPLTTIWPYACSDADATRLLALKFEGMLKEQDGGKLFDLYHAIAKPLAEVIAYMEMTGLDVDVGRVERNKVDLTKRMVEIKVESQRLVGFDFDIGSPEQLGKVLFEHLKLPGGKRNKTSWTADKEVLARLQDDHPIVPLAQEYRRISKLRGTYVEGLDTKLIGGRYYPPWNQIGTISGRFSTELVNLMPREEKGGAVAKGQFRAPDGHVLLFRDLSQIELRMGAHLSQDQFMLDGYIKGGKDFDLHSKTAAGVFPNIHAPADWPDPNDFAWVKKAYKKYRSISKNINFLTAYGGGANKLMTMVNKEFPDDAITIEQAQGFIDEYFKVMTGLAKCIRETHANLRRDGYVVSLFGRKRRLPDAQIQIWDRMYPKINYECFGRDCVKFGFLNLDETENVQTQTVLAAVVSHNEHVRDQKTGNAPYDKCVRRLATYDSPEGYCTELVRCVMERERRSRQFTISEAQRQSFNFLLQSAAADYTNLSLVKIWDYIKANNVQSRPVLQIHDALGFLVPNSEVEMMLRLTKDIMEHAYPLTLPVGSEAGVAKYWGEEDNKKPSGECKACKSALDVKEIAYESFGEVSAFTEYTATCTNVLCASTHSVRVFKTSEELS